MSDRTAITVLVAPDVLAFLQAEAQRASAQLQRDGNHQPGDDMPIESVASVILEDAVRTLLMANASTSTLPKATNAGQEELDEATAARVLELLAAGLADEAHELVKTIETPAIREPIERHL